MRLVEVHIVELYGEAELQRLRRKVRGWRIALCSLALAALAACVVMAALTNTANAARMELAAVAVNVAAGWIVIYCGIFVAAAGRHELEHAEMLGKVERTRIVGTATVTDRRVVIRRSIAARHVEVRGNGEVYRLLVCESRAEALEKAEAAALYVAHGYVAAYER